eukprot:TRINITY_DN653_c1_g1_i1.p1 TRINITY_DN653_c1_g1~~TRINITY_DN653_c1_g1_i1.p1  ORF type:complete len:359 (-),score=123.61 TRINITY_DN653_c1_g1_i1:371-1447(-)
MSVFKSLTVGLLLFVSVFATELVTIEVVGFYGSPRQVMQLDVRMDSFFDGVGFIVQGKQCSNCSGQPRYDEKASKTSKNLRYSEEIQCDQGSLSGHLDSDVMTVFGGSKMSPVGQISSFVIDSSTCSNFVNQRASILQFSPDKTIPEDQVLPMVLYKSSKISKPWFTPRKRLSGDDAVDYTIGEFAVDQTEVLSNNFNMTNNVTVIKQWNPIKGSKTWTVDNVGLSVGAKRMKKATPLTFSSTHDYAAKGPKEDVLSIMKTIGATRTSDGTYVVDALRVFQGELPSLVFSDEKNSTLITLTANDYAPIMGSTKCKVLLEMSSDENEWRLGVRAYQGNGVAFDMEKNTVGFYDVPKEEK